MCRYSSLEVEDDELSPSSSGSPCVVFPLTTVSVNLALPSWCAPLVTEYVMSGPWASLAPCCCSGFGSSTFISSAFAPRAFSWTSLSRQSSSNCFYLGLTCLSWLNCIQRDVKRSVHSIKDGLALVRILAGLNVVIKSCHSVYPFILDLRYAWNT